MLQSHIDSWVQACKTSEQETTGKKDKFSLHGLGHPARCWWVWAYRSWPPVSSRCPQRPGSLGGCRPAGAPGSLRFLPPSIWSCGTRTCGRKPEKLCEDVTIRCYNLNLCGRTTDDLQHRKEIFEQQTHWSISSLKYKFLTLNKKTKKNFECYF